jgi:hypothetical protein
MGNTRGDVFYPEFAVWDIESDIAAVFPSLSSIITYCRKRLNYTLALDRD